VAKGGEPAVNKAGGANPAIGLMAVLGNMPPPKVTINEMTTVASVGTHNQFIDGTAIKGPALSLHIAAGNVPNLVDLQTGGGGALQAPLNRGRPRRMPNLPTVPTLLPGWARGVRPMRAANSSQRQRLRSARPQATL